MNEQQLVATHRQNTRTYVYTSRLAEPVNSYTEQKKLLSSFLGNLIRDTVQRVAKADVVQNELAVLEISASLVTMLAKYGVVKVAVAARLTAATVNSTWRAGKRVTIRRNIDVTQWSTNDKHDARRATTRVLIRFGCHFC